MATLKEHQEAMVQLLANGSGIPASASRLAHAMHDVLEALTHSDLMQFVQKEQIRVRELNDATTPGLNDKALSKREKALKTDSPAKWPTPAEHRIKELENTIKQLKANNRVLRQEVSALRNTLEFADGVTTEKQFMAEQAGCRREDTQVTCEHVCDHAFDVVTAKCDHCGISYYDLKSAGEL